MNGAEFILIASFVDAYLYGYCYEYRLVFLSLRNANQGLASAMFSQSYAPGIFGGRVSDFVFRALRPVIKFLFIEWKPGAEKLVPFYRVLVQWPLDIAGLYFTWKYSGLYDLAGTLLALYFMVKEALYYVWLNQFDEVKLYEEKIRLGFMDVWWLKRIYFAGAWEFRPFTYYKFVVSFLAGVTLYYLFFIIQQFSKFF